MMTMMSQLPMTQPLQQLWLFQQGGMNMGNAMTTTDNALGNATSATGMIKTTSTIPTVRCVQFCDQPVQ